MAAEEDLRARTAQEIPFPKRNKKPPWYWHLRRLYDPQRTKRLNNTLALVITVAGVCGVTLTGYWPIPIIVGVLIIGYCLIWLPPNECDVYNGENEVNLVWDEMLRSAQESLEIVAGDLSWFDDSRQMKVTLAAHRSRGRTVKIICKEPDNKPVLRRRIAFLFEQKIEVRVLPKACRPTYSGFIIDREQPDRCTAFRHSTKSSQGEFGEKEEKRGRRHVSGRDDEYMSMWLPLVSSYWEQSTQAILLSPIHLAGNNSTLVFNALRKVNQYQKLDSSLFKLDFEVEAESLYAWCLRQDKLARLTSVMDQMAAQRIEQLTPCTCWSNAGKTILLPPVVEEHDGKLVIMDGAHRIAYLHRNNPKARVRVIKISGCEPLPGTPVALSKIRTAMNRLGSSGRGSFIDHYSEQYWRSFTPMLDFLEQEARKFSE